MSAAPRRAFPRDAVSCLLVTLALVAGAGAAAMGGLGHTRLNLLLLAAIPVLLAGWVLSATHHDATTFLIIAAAALLLMPARLHYPPLGAAGSPATMLALVAGWLWIQGVLVPSLGSARGAQPVRWILALYMLTVVASFVAASLRGPDPIEAKAADRGLVLLAAAVGIGLLAADGIHVRARLDDLLRAIVVLGCGLAVVGIVQFIFSFDLAGQVRLPEFSFDGQSSEVQSSAVQSRSGFNRVAGTTYHPIEFSAVLTMLLPLALHYTAFAEPGRRRRWWVAVALIATAIPMTVSRTGSVGLFVVALVLVPTFTPLRRRQALVASVVFAVLMRGLVPGLLGTMRALLLGAAGDPSVAARQTDYSYVSPFVREQPLFGRGFATFLPSRYDFLDNQLILSLVETGVIGLLALIGVFVVAMSCARGARHRSADPSTRDLGQSLVASLLVALVACGTFDLLSFPTARGLVFLVAGCAGALWRFERDSTPTMPVLIAARINARARR